MDSQHDKGREKRQHTRFPFKQGVKFQVGDYSCLEGSLSKDVSSGGICLTVSQFVPIHSTVLLHLQQHLQAKVITLKGMVTWVRIISDSERYQVGVYFQELNESGKKEISKIIEALVKRSSVVERRVKKDG